MTKARAWFVLARGGVILFITLPRLPALDRFVTPDEHLWVTRSVNFYDALGQSDFSATFQKQHPRVTVMWIGATAFLFQVAEYGGSEMGQLIGTLPAVVAFLPVAFDPFPLGLPGRLHLDGLLSNLVLLSVLAWISYRVNSRIYKLR